MSEIEGNFSEVEAGLRRVPGLVDQMASGAISLIARQMYDNAKKNADTASNPPLRVNGRLRYQPHIGPRSGEGPNRGTGNLLRSMTFSSSRTGLGTYTAIVGAGVVYARALELGIPSWTSGVKFPYMEPALKQLVTERQLQRILAYSFSRLGG